MWIRTQGGYLLNLDGVEFINYDETRNQTFAHTTHTHMIGEGDLRDFITGAIRCNTTILEVHSYGN